MIEYIIFIAGFTLNGLNPLSAIYLALAWVHFLETRHHFKHYGAGELVFYGGLTSWLYLLLAIKYALAH
jgi:hypothetical protein